MPDPIDALPTPPSRSDAPATFISRANAFIAALVNFVTQTNAVATAMNLNATSGTSTTSNSIGTGAKTFTADTGKSWLPGMFIVIADTSAPSTNSMLAQVTSYNSGTGELVVDVKSTLGSGTKTAWTISQTANPVPLDNSVATASIQSEAVTPAKLSKEAKTAKLQSVVASVAANALTVTINPTTLDFRSTTLTDGTPTSVTLGSAASVVVPDTATLGTANGVSARLAVLAINNAGTIEAAVVNIAGGTNLDETGLISTTAISTSADSNNVIYSTTARSNVAYRVVGFIDISEATAGTWATAPTKVQGTGGQALAAMATIGYGQTRQDVTASRALATNYTNTTGRPIWVTVEFTRSAGTISQATLTVGGVQYSNTVSSASSAVVWFISQIVMPGETYRADNVANSALSKWYEVR